MATRSYPAGDGPDPANPSPWWRSQLASEPGPFEVSDEMFPARGLDVSTVSLIGSGVIVIPIVTP